VYFTGRLITVKPTILTHSLRIWRWIIDFFKNYGFPPLVREPYSQPKAYLKMKTGGGGGGGGRSSSSSSSSSRW